MLRIIADEPRKDPSQWQQAEHTRKCRLRGGDDAPATGLFGPIRIQQQRPRHPGLRHGTKNRYQPFYGAVLDLAIRVQHQDVFGVAGANSNIAGRAKSNIAIVLDDGNAWI